MTAERLAVWLAAVGCVAVTWLGYAGGVPTPPERLVAIGLGVVVALPLAVVVLAWCSSFRKRQRGWT